MAEISNSSYNNFGNGDNGTKCAASLMTGTPAAEARKSSEVKAAGLKVKKTSREDLRRAKAGAEGDITLVTLRGGC